MDRRGVLTMAEDETTQMMRCRLIAAAEVLGRVGTSGAPATTLTSPGRFPAMLPSVPPTLSADQTACAAVALLPSSYCFVQW